MDRLQEQRLATLLPLCTGVEEAIVRDFVIRMDPEYFGRFQPVEIARHIGLAARLNPDQPCSVSITETPDGQLDMTVVAYDYFSEFATICGLLSSFGLDIREGEIYTLGEAMAPASSFAPTLSYSPGGFRRPRGKAGPSAGLRAGLTRQKIVDVFRVRPLPAMPFHPQQQRRFAEHLDKAIRLLDQNRVQEARRLVNRRLVETLSRSRGALSAPLYPIQIRFDNEHSPTETIMDIRSTDTPAFLYAFANALTMRGLYVSKARFESVGAELHDRFFVRGRHGGKILDHVQQQELRLTATLIKQFTHVLTWAPDPATAIEHFDQFLDRLMEEAGGGKALPFLQDKKTLAQLAKLLGTSDFLWEDFLRRQHANLLPMLNQYQRLPLIRPQAAMARALQRRLAGAGSESRWRKLLNQYKDEELFRIDMKHLMDEQSTLQDFSRALTDLAEIVLTQATRDCQNRLSRQHGRPKLASGGACPFAVFGLGKFGGRELGYASDIEVLFAYEGAGRTNGRKALENSEYFERLVQAVLQSIEAKQEGIFHLDVRLRPHGGKGLLANQLAELRTYYSPVGLSAPFERQALIKLRFVAGDERLGREVEAYRDAFVYSGAPWDLAAALDLRHRQIKELVEPERTNVKYSPGGLLDVEYAVQYLQLMHGHAYPRLRTPSTLEALAALGEIGLLGQEESKLLREAYLFLRTLIDALRIVRGNAKDLVLPPSDSEAFVFLARRMGYTAERWEEGAAQLAAEIARQMGQTKAIFDSQFRTGQTAS
jgi:glutamate-ammonia-ligase adenylyltransferase